MYLLPPPGAGDENERCLSVFVTLGHFAFALTGDLDAAGERTLLRLYDIPPAEVVVAGHHGSRHATSEEWLAALDPQAVAFSVGRNNYGHPTPEAMSRAILSGARVYRTDLAGSVRIRVGG